MLTTEEVNQLKIKHPLIENIINQEEILWLNPLLTTSAIGIKETGLTAADVEDAANRLKRFAPYIEKTFPETKHSHGIIESPLTSISKMKNMLEKAYGLNISGEILIKEDNVLPISGSIKARGGIYEVLKNAETLAVQNGLISTSEDYAKFAQPAFKELFAQHKIAVGSTGNLGLSIGIMSAKLGFRVTVHMSADAKQWKKDLLREKGVVVVEYEDDYSKAVEEGRRQAKADSTCHFVDDEHSHDLFLGYAVAGERLAMQLAERGTKVDEHHPLFVYLPCGVGGGPGGVAFGLKLVFGDNVECFFAEPTQSPCMMLGMMTQLHEQISVHDFGLNNKTAADGLAVASPSGFVGKTMAHLLTGCYSTKDETMYDSMKMLADAEDIWIEPSAAAGITGPIFTISNNVKEAASKNATHLIWATGGSMVPKSELDIYYKKARK